MREEDARRCRSERRSRILKKGQRTKSRILDAAEQLFPDVGIHGVSMRNISEFGNIPLGVLTYHFSSKEDIFRHVIARRAEELNHRRAQSIGLLSPDASLEDIMRAFLAPAVELTRDGGAGWRVIERRTNGVLQRRLFEAMNN